MSFPIHLTVSLLFIILPSKTSSTVPCPLYWTHYDYENFNSSSRNYVFTYGSSHIVARVKDGNNTYHAGYFVVDHNVAYIPISPYKFAELQLLYNVHNCTISWAQKETANKKAFVSVDSASNSTNYIGRMATNRFVFVGLYQVSLGEVVEEMLKYVSVRSVSSIELRVTEDYQYMSSTSKGLDLHLKDFNFTSVPSAGNYRVVNVESIDNYGDCIVSQVVTHSKIVTSSHSFSEFGSNTKSWGISASATFTYPPFSGSVSGSYSKENEDSWSETLTTSTERRVTISKNITVGPQEAILACSAIQMNDNFQSGYRARAEYSAPGLNGRDVKEILESYGFMNVSQSEHSAWFYTEGEYKGAASLTTHFHVSPKAAQINCRNIKDFGV